MPFPNPVQRLLKEALADISAKQGYELTQAEASRLCKMSPKTFGQLLTTRFPRYQQLDPDKTIPRLAAGLGIPEHRLHLAAAQAAGYRISPPDESDLAALVEERIGHGPDPENVRALRRVRDAIQCALDRWLDRTTGPSVQGHRIGAQRCGEQSA